MRKFLLRILLFCLMPLPMLLFLDHAVTKGLHRSRFLYYGEWSDLFNARINADVLIMGTSRAYVHVSPKILDSMLATNSYNLGMDGASVDIQRDILALYLQHNKKPKYILQEIGYPTFVRSQSSQYFQEFKAYLQDTSVWRILQQHYPQISLADKYAPLYRYNGDLVLIKEGIMSYMGRGTKDLKYKGYEPRTYPWDSSFYEFKEHNPNGKRMKIDAEMVQQFNDYLGWCRANDIKVVLFMAPTYYESVSYILNFSEVQEIVTDCAKKHRLLLLDYTADSLSMNRGYFYNSQHLNKKGAELFSVQLANDIKLRTYIP